VRRGCLSAAEREDERSDAGSECSCKLHGSPLRLVTEQRFPRHTAGTTVSEQTYDFRKERPAPGLALTRRRSGHDNRRRRLVGELLPLCFGLLLGVALGRLRPALRLPVGAALAVALGFVATAATGEAAISWAFVLIDIPIVALGALVARLVERRLAPALHRA
jgi:hypothetical protein